MIGLESRRRNRERERAMYNGMSWRGLGMVSARKGQSSLPPLEADRERRYALVAMQTLGERLCGDPPPGLSALAKRRALYTPTSKTVVVRRQAQQMNKWQVNSGDHYLDVSLPRIRALEDV